MDGKKGEIHNADEKKYICHGNQTRHLVKLWEVYFQKLIIVDIFEKKVSSIIMKAIKIYTSVQ